MGRLSRKAWMRASRSGNRPAQKSRLAPAPDTTSQAEARDHYGSFPQVSVRAYSMQARRLNGPSAAEAS